MPASELNFQFSSRRVTSKIGATVNFLSVVAADATVCISPAAALFMEKNMMCALKVVIFMEPSLQKIYSSGQH